MKNSPSQGRRGRVAASPITDPPVWHGDTPEGEQAVKLALLTMIESNGGHIATRYADALFPVKDYRRSQCLAWLGDLEKTHLRRVTRTRRGSSSTYDALYLSGYLHDGRLFTVRELAALPANVYALTYQALALRLKTMSVADALSKPPSSHNGLNALKKAA